MNQPMSKLTIVHNHGSIIMKDAVLQPYEVTNRFGTHQCNTVKGEVIGGASTNRLFHATSTKQEPVGVVKEVDIWGRKPYQQTDGSWYVDICVCG